MPSPLTTDLSSPRSRDGAIHGSCCQQRPCSTRKDATGRGGVFIFHALAIRSLSTRLRGGGSLFPQQRLPLTNRPIRFCQMCPYNSLAPQINQAWFGRIYNSLRTVVASYSHDSKPLISHPLRFFQNAYDHIYALPHPTVSQLALTSFHRHFHTHTHLPQSWLSASTARP